MARQENKPFEVCWQGLKCPRKYLDDFNNRKAEFGPENQGTGDMAKDLEAIAEGIGLKITVEKADCFELCPLPGEPPNVIDPKGNVHQVYYRGLSQMLQDWKNNP